MEQYWQVYGKPVSIHGRVYHSNKRVKNRLEQDTELPNWAIMSGKYHRAVGVLSKQHPFPVPRPVLWINSKLQRDHLLVQLWPTWTWRAFEHRVITTALNPTRIWKRYVDDTFVIQHQSHKVEFFRHTNSVDPSIQFPVEELKNWWFHTISRYHHTTQADGTLTTGVYRKPTQTDLYLPWDSHHNFASKYSVINTLTHRAKAICSTPQLLKMN